MQAVYNIAEICARHGITDVVLSPGSRSAPLTLAFARHPNLTVRVVPDERAAAFIGLGIAQAQKRAVALVCTSGTAGLNYAPAVAEAFFQLIPLVIFTADRPPEWIDQLDGQTIRQRNLYGAHAKGAFEFPVDISHADAKWFSARLVNEAINLAQAAPAGPVQVNVPLREPFYPKAGEEIRYEQDVKIIRESGINSSLEAAELQALANEFGNYSKILFVFGQQPDGESPPFTDQVLANANAYGDEISGAVFIGDVISNLGPGQIIAEHWHIIRSHDVTLAGLSAEQKYLLQPDLVITCGLSLISKSLKQFLRAHPPKQHWHVQLNGATADTFGSLTSIIRADPNRFLTALLECTSPLWLLPDEINEARSNYQQRWTDHERQAKQLLNEGINFLDGNSHKFNEFTAFKRTLAALTPHTALHLANSMAVRYANILGIPQGRHIEVFANRGTSGIDGCNSTAVGAALAQPERPVVLLTGDVAFFYDRNAFWHNYPTPNLRVVLFNNHGGGIFRLIDGPRQQPELEEFFETRQTLTSKNTARDFNLRYFPVSSFAELDAALPVFFAAETGAAILEIFTDSKTNAALFEEYRTAVKQAFS
ncbi:2-succinyl-5-enolpyruvyl-6-hydroxy-3-cyclohexene-1-carboxylic-acid synthase [Hymenobacter lapidarius]|uniref:2-succinyl-5-enolpyruvyl-6-hydroxy-3-cyclohexene-1-carboxylate synthase n=1 Tax=Hymenobacter lapidarius TaxID=1908237 RepID=A0A1G1TEF5_9BACT|nr:2-succinyl-5-enolpyruvyl-6-hydroxy-3-cyclohexene-1-carboxylic-acid synthase [Hymenobacter lapidarius]OGX89250.1 2-succinyl-5-enolpyruvyl-6-hydroxy-3-cyclohexene-1-carboxylic-acid synthase [Hymenobacter lapidarius]